MFPENTSPTSTFPYRIEGKVGEGSMGTVYCAVDPDLNRRVAVKVVRAEALQGLSADDRAEVLRRFLQEARAAAALTHPGVTTIHRIGEEAGTPYIVMEWLEGQTLEDLLRGRAPLPIPEAARIGVDLAEALDAAHGQGVVHRDIKPANLVVLNDGRLKVTDFGIARVDGSDLVKTKAGDVLATPMYASPEQLSARDVDGRSDIFSAGVVLYFALTGRLPFTGRNFVELSTAILYTNPAPPRNINPAIPVELEAIILRALHKDRDMRFARARDLARVLRAFTHEGALAASPISGTAFATPFPDALVPGAPPSHEAIFRGLSASAPLAIVEVVSRWAARKLGRDSVPTLLSRLLEFPLHAEPFAGAVRIGKSLLLLHDGWILAALDVTGDRSGDDVVDALPAEAEVVLHAVPPSLPPRVVPLLATLLSPPERRRFRHQDLDSSFVNLPALARKLQDEAFSGILTLRRNADVGWVLLESGRTALTLFSDGWDEAPLEQSWQTWVSDLVVRASVEEAAPTPVYDSYRRVLRNFEVKVEVDASGQPKRLTAGTLFQSLRRTSFGKTGGTTHRLVSAELQEGAVSGTSGVPKRILADGFAHDGARRFLSYLLDDLPETLEKRGKTESLKYVATWIPLVRKATLHHDLPRPQGRESDFFDLVTFDDDGKALHLAQRVARGTPEALEEFVERVTAAKTARIKTGDVGGAFLIAPSFDEEAAEVYRVATTHEGESSRFLFGAIEAATSYEGFVRIGPRRGFHLVLVTETPSGFEALLS